MHEIEQKHVAIGFFDQVLNLGKVDQLENFITPDFVYHARGETIEGANAFKEWLAADREIFSNIHYTVVGSIAEYNRVATAFIIDAVHAKDFRGIPASHTKIETVGVSIFHFRGDKIKTIWTIIDGLTPAIQLGVLKTSDAQSVAS